MDIDSAAGTARRDRQDSDRDYDRSERRSRRDYPDKERHRDDRPRYRSRDRRDRERRDRRRSRSPNDSKKRDRSGERRRDRSHDRDGDREHKRSRHERSHRDRDDRYPRKSDEEGKSRNRDGNDGPPVKRNGPLPTQEDSWAITKGEEPEKPKEKPNFGNSGLLAAASNSVQQADGTSITLKYHEPAEARKPSPKDVWKLFVFKGEDVVDTIDLGARSCWLVGRDLAVVDLRAEHPSISKQHAVLQFRYTEKRNEFGDKKGKVKPYLIDLESANGTMLNGEKVPDSRYLELRHKDMVQFGDSTREYVVMLAPRD